MDIRCAMDGVTDISSSIVRLTPTRDPLDPRGPEIAEECFFVIQL